MKNRMPGKGLSGTQVTSSNGRAASGVVCQSNKTMARGDRKDPVSHAQMPGKKLSGAQTRNSSTVVKQ